MNLARFPRRRYTVGPTPLEAAPRFSAALGGPEIYLKRDDLLGTRRRRATRRGSWNSWWPRPWPWVRTPSITCGAIQSNHCRLTLAAAVKEGLKCRLVLEERVPGTYNPRPSGNNFLYRLLGVEEVRSSPAGSDMTAGDAGGGREPWRRRAARATSSPAAGPTPWGPPGTSPAPRRSWPRASSRD